MKIQCTKCGQPTQCPQRLDALGVHVDQIGIEVAATIVGQLAAAEPAQTDADFLRGLRIDPDMTPRFQGDFRMEDPAP